VLALDEALAALSKIDPRKGRVVELRYFGGLSVEETAEVLQVAPETHHTCFSMIWSTIPYSLACSATIM
jgi:DNA-directed RNA polymerase specialized sigma24 family protein